jgi:hypothetical protein
MPLDLAVLIRVLDEHSKEMKEVSKCFLSGAVRHEREISIAGR